MAVSLDVLGETQDILMDLMKQSGLFKSMYVSAHGNNVAIKCM